MIAGAAVASDSPSSASDILPAQTEQEPAATR
jgi:hypothetical protein